jgi:lysophospholipase L1-like esterase
MGDRILRRRRAAFAAGLATLALALGTAAGPATAAPALAYVALGDSYAAGQGAGSYLDSACLRSVYSYPADAMEKKAVRLAINAACQGSTTEVVVATQLERLNKSIAVVTITAGGNNLDTTGLLAVCTSPDQAACLQGLQTRSIALAEAVTGSGPLFQGLVTMISAVKAKAPDARVYVTGYPLLFHSPEPGSLQENVNGLTLGLNAVIAAAAGADGPGGAQYVDVSGAFMGHGIGSSDPWINYNPFAPGPDDFHPNTAGYRAYYAALTAAGAYSSP